MEINHKEIQDHIQLMEQSTFVHLSVNTPAGFPELRAMLNLRNPDFFPTLTALYEREANPFTVYLSTNTSSRKMKFILADPRICVYFTRPQGSHGLQLGGLVEAVEDAQLKRDFWVEGWEQYYHEGIDDPDYTLLRLEPTFARGWYYGRHFEFDPKEMGEG